MSTEDEARARALLARSRDWHRQEDKRLTRILDLLDSAQPPPEEAPVKQGPPRITSATSANRPSVRSLLIALLNSEDRDWSAGEVLAEYKRRGTPVHGADPNNALRAAISESNKTGQIFRTAPGRYKSTRWRQDPIGLPLAPDFGAHRFDTEAAS